MMNTKKNARTNARPIVTALEGYAKRTKGITSVKASYFFDYVRIDIHAPKSSGKVYREMVEYLNSLMHDHEEDSNADWWHSHDEYTRDNDLVADSEVEVNVCVYHW